MMDPLRPIFDETLQNFRTSIQQLQQENSALTVHNRRSGNRHITIVQEEEEESLARTSNHIVAYSGNN